MRTTLKLSRVGMNMEEAQVVRWLKQVGETFKTGEPLYEIETDKVSTAVEAPCDGTMVEIVAAPDSTIAVGAVVCRIET